MAFVVTHRKRVYTNILSEVAFIEEEKAMDFHAPDYRLKNVKASPTSTCALDHLIKVAILKANHPLAERSHDL
jgi:hypothetical protein